jgi:hypothetical protein
VREDAEQAVDYSGFIKTLRRIIAMDILKVDGKRMIIVINVND